MMKLVCVSDVEMIQWTHSDNFPAITRYACYHFRGSPDFSYYSANGPVKPGFVDFQEM